MHSPLLSPTPLTPTIHHHSYQPTQPHFPQHHHLQLHHQPLSAGPAGQQAAIMQYSPESPLLSKPHLNPSGSGGYFQWPTYKTETTSAPTCYQQAQTGYGGGGGASTSRHSEESPSGMGGYHIQYSSSNAATTQLPDFDSVFTSPGSMHGVYNDP